VGIRRGDVAAVTANTKRVLRVSVTPSTTG